MGPQVAVLKSMLAESYVGREGEGRERSATSYVGTTRELDAEPHDRAAASRKLEEETRHRSAMKEAAAIHEAALAGLRGVETELERGQAEAAAERAQWERLREELQDQTANARHTNTHSQTRTHAHAHACTHARTQTHRLAAQRESEKVAALRAQVRHALRSASGCSMRHCCCILL